MTLIHKNVDGNGNGGFFLKISWGVVLSIIVTLTIAIFGVVNTFNTSEHSQLSNQIKSLATSTTAMAATTSQNCIDIAVLKTNQNNVIETLKGLQPKIDEIRKDQLEYYKSRGFKPSEGAKK